MFKLIASLAALILSLLLGSIPAHATGVLPPCQNEDCSIGTNEDGSTIYQDGYWDASKQGDGSGSSFYVIDGQTTYTTPVEEHTCAPGYVIVPGERTCIVPELSTAPAITAPVTAPAPPAPVEVAPAPVNAPVATVDPVTYPDLSTASLASYNASIAWAMFDATGAASLLPTAYDTTVSYVGTSATPLTPTADTIVVWDAYGIYYLFLITAS